ncbi:MAG: GNAT family N-acetyltransferase [Candidatus Eisenbacteria bacterium]|nr:GNAT family N-acetyltransferase [Candidatus Eisenbacteria bacterium]
MKPMQLNSLDPYDWGEFVAASKTEGHGMVERLVSEFRAGTNTFNEQGEALFALVEDGRIIAVAGLNREPDPTLAGSGRIRRLYVLPGRRGRGLGRLLVDEVTRAAARHFEMLTANAGTLDARRFYDHLGFKPVRHPGITHAKRLRSSPR